MKKDTVAFRGEEVLIPSEGLEADGVKWTARGEVPEVGRWLELSPDCPVPRGWRAVKRKALWTMDEELFFRANRLYAEMDWKKSSRYCGRCGGKTEEGDDKGQVCTVCGHRTYPIICPAVIVAVEREGKLLLAHNTRFPKGRYSVLAGFLELGESLEDAVKREIKEEVDLEVDSLEYFGSQSWPFPRSLMVAFRAKWKSGEIKEDNVEIGCAGWFSPEDMPEIPRGPSISGKLIDDFIIRHRRQNETEESSCF